MFFKILMDCVVPSWWNDSSEWAKCFNRRPQNFSGLIDYLLTVQSILMRSLPLLRDPGSFHLSQLPSSNSSHQDRSGRRRECREGTPRWTVLAILSGTLCCENQEMFGCVSRGKKWVWWASRQLLPPYSWVKSSCHWRQLTIWIKAFFTNVKLVSFSRDYQ